jgi:predicted transcriptional regulator of viral defense system
MLKLNKRSLSALEQQIYFLSQGAKNNIITYDTIRSWGLADENVLNVVLSRMCKKGWFTRIKRGVYLLSGYGKGIVDIFYTAQFVYPGYLAFSTALYLHKLIDEMPFTIYIATKEISGSKNLGEYTIKAVSLGKRAIGIQRIGDYWISTIPKTLYDCLHFPEYGGGYSRILKSIHSAKMNEKQWEEFIDYVKKFDSDASCQKIGYLLDLLKKTRMNIPSSVFSYLQKRVKSVVLLGKGTKGKFNKKWKIVDRIGEQTLLSWWYRG